MTEILERELGWNDEIENDGKDFILLPEGDYSFTVSAFERGRHEGSAKLPACPKAIVSLDISSPDGVVTLKNNLFLHTKTEGLLCAFFTAIGQRKHGEKLRMDWSKVVGSGGRCKIVQKVSEKNPDLRYNSVQKFYVPEEQAEQGNNDLPWKDGQF